MEASGPPTLVACLLDGREIWKKVLHLNTTAEIVETAKRSLTCRAELDRFLIFNSSFDDFVDTDIGGNVAQLDKYQILFKSMKPEDEQQRQLAQPSRLSTDAPGPSGQSGDQPSTHEAPGPSGQREAGQLSAGAARQSGPTQNGQGQLAHSFDAASLGALIDHKAPLVRAEYEKSGTLSGASRKLLVRICVGDLVERRGFYPGNPDKVILAKSIITVFPSLQIKMGEENEGFEHFFDPVSHSGFIEVKLRNLRRTLHEDQRRYSKRGSSSGPSAFGPIAVTVTMDMSIGEESVTEWITATKRLRPTAENSTAIKKGMEETYAHRRLWINGESPTMEEIFQQYPRFIDLPYLFDAEFTKMFPGKEDLFLRKWEGHIVPKLLKVAAMEKDLSFLLAGEESDESRSFRALQILTHLLPPTASGRTKGSTKISVKSALSYMLDIKPNGTSIPSLVESPDAEVGASFQPKLVCLGHPSTTAQYIIVVKNDKVAIPLQDEGLACALDKLFKVFWVCNVSYPPPLLSVYAFLEHFYGIAVTGTKRSKVVELIAKLQAV